MTSQVEKSLRIQYPPSPASSIYSDRSTPSPDSGLECNRSQSSETNFHLLRSDDGRSKRKISTSSEASYISSLSCDGGFSDRPITPDELIQGSNKYDDIIDKIDNLKFSPRNSNLNLNDPEITYNIIDKDKDNDCNDDNDDDDLQEKGPEPKIKHSRRKPYESIEDWTESASIELQGYALDHTARQIMQFGPWKELLTSCMDRCLVNDNGESRNCINNEWLENNTENVRANTQSDERSLPSIPSIILNEEPLQDEELLLNEIGLQKFQPAQSDISNPNTSPSGSTENWPDSPISSHNPLFSRCHSRASSRAQSPGSSANLDTCLNTFGSSPQWKLPFRQPRTQSTSSSSNYSFGDTSSPLNYHHPLDSKTEEHLEMNFGNFGSCLQNCELSDTIINNSDNINDVNTENQFIEGIKDNFDVNQMEFLLNCRNDPITCRMPTRPFGDNQNVPNDIYSNNNQSDLSNTGNLINSALFCTDYIFDNYDQSFPINIQSNSSSQHDLTNNEVSLDVDAELGRFLESSYNTTNTGCHSDGFNIHEENILELPIQQSYPVQQQFSNYERPSTSVQDTFTIPEPVTQYKTSRSRKNSFRNIWQSLNLPTTRASETLKSQVDTTEVEKVMKNLLLKSNEELAKPDKDGYTMLMCLVGNPSEFHQNKAFLAPLVERIKHLPDGLTKTNNREEDALYLAAMHCPDMPYVAGYLAAVMIQRGIDISQGVYQTRGNTLIHALAALGDIHKAVLAELLCLKNIQGNSVFDLSKCNYDGRTPLHVAVESHDPSGSGINSLSVIQLLLENGADAKVKEANRGNTALHLAVSLSSDPNLIQMLLINRGSEALNILNRNKDTPLHMAAVIHEGVSLEIQMNICMNLIKAGALTNIINAQGKTPLALVSAERKKFIRNIFYKKS